MIQTPLNLEVLLHCYYSPEPHPRRQAPSVQKAFDYLLLTKMISGPEEGNIFHTTPRGEAFIKHLMTVPFPEIQWVIPERTIDDGQ